MNALFDPMYLALQAVIPLITLPETIILKQHALLLFRVEEVFYHSEGIQTCVSN